MKINSLKFSFEQIGHETNKFRVTFLKMNLYNKKKQFSFEGNYYKNHNKTVVMYDRYCHFTKFKCNINHTLS
jgi:hypothetical protein